MAKRKKSRKSGRRGTGSIVTTRRKLSGLGQIKNPRSTFGAILPPLVGGAATALVTFGIKHMAAKKQATLGRTHWHQMYGLGAGQQAQQQQAAALTAPQQAPALPPQDASALNTANYLYDWAPALGVVSTWLIAGILGRKGGMIGRPAALGLAAGAAGVGGALAIHGFMAKRGIATQGVGAVVAEYGTGAIVMEPNADQGWNAYSGGADVNVQGVGATMNTQAFGTQTF